MLPNQVSGNTAMTPSRVILETIRACKSQVNVSFLGSFGFVVWTLLEVIEYVLYTVNHRITLGRTPKSRIPRLTFNWTTLPDPPENLRWTKPPDYTWILSSPTSRRRALRRLLGHQKAPCLPRMSPSCPTVSMLVMLVPPPTLTSTVTASMELLKSHSSRCLQ